MSDYALAQRPADRAPRTWADARGTWFAKVAPSGNARRDARRARAAILAELTDRYAPSLDAHALAVVAVCKHPDGSTTYVESWPTDRTDKLF